MAVNDLDEMRRLAAAARAEMEEPAQLAYAAYGKVTGGVNYQGLPMPDWDALPDQIKAAWRAAAQAAQAAMWQAGHG